MPQKDFSSGIHVLIAEDNEDTRELLEVVLTHAAAVAVSALVAAPDIERAKALGYTEHVAKPADPGHLAALIAELVRRSKHPAS